MINHTSNLIEAINNFLASKVNLAISSVSATYVWVSETTPPHGFDWDFFFKALAAFWIAIQIFRAMKELSNYLVDKYEQRKRKKSAQKPHKQHW